MASVLAATPRAEEPVPLREVLARAGAAAERFGRDLQGIVARERYLQTIRPWMGSAPERVAEVPAMTSRRLVASLLLVHDPQTPWQLHRDVVSVDDEPVEGRDARLAALFADPSLEARERLRRITEDSARHNLGHVRRTINVPTFPLLLVHPAYADRFRASDRGTLHEEGATLRLVALRERGRPRVIRGDRLRDVELRALLAIDEATGEIVRAVLTPRGGDLRAHLEVTFARVAGMPVRVPVRLWEWYWVHDVPERDRYVEGEATYDDFRRYTTDASAPQVK
ncbi:hypothetical protein [Luteitalea sp.]|uniref:hypothetical protein n=1 Tax=Luteitalea sp. TaxID=2004800 RepID=UPI0037C4FF1C